MNKQLQKLLTIVLAIIFFSVTSFAVTGLYGHVYPDTTATTLCTTKLLNYTEIRRCYLEVRDSNGGLVSAGARVNTFLNYNTSWIPNFSNDTYNVEWICPTGVVIIPLDGHTSVFILDNITIQKDFYACEPL